MARKCSSIRRLSSASSKFHKYASFLTPKLHQLYRLTYEEPADQDTETTAGGWSGADFFHGTGHCGCLGVQVNRKVDKNVDITAEEWCSSSSPTTACATRGILSFGHVDTCLVSAGGHFFSPRMAVAHAWARFRSPSQSTVPIFVCKARNIRQKWVESFFVESENDIMPCYLAIVSY